ncbi:hypothetical protein QJS04_geneDACA012150 [Acorus gramineus]|uniref:AtTam37 zinc finger domain-containing protein n=1 Tax=Acorus gramineus TaxID=55184 RepID=A0AAV9BA86_ACOGR|nr:hypothetical protein QJS04_geneDACA012150 [Acorus gramineus]
MGRGTARMARAMKRFMDVHVRGFSRRYGRQIVDILQLPVKAALLPFTLPFDIAGSAPRGFGLPKLVSDLSFSAIFVIGTLGTYDIAMEVGRKLICQRDCRTCNGWNAMRCITCKGTGRVHYQVKNCVLQSGKRATAECVAEAIVENRAELVHIPSTLDPSIPLPSKECPTCDGSGVMSCPECQHRLQIKISADDIMEPPWKALNVMRKMDYPYENIVRSMRDPKIAAFWLITMPQIMGGFNFDDEVKQKIWWAYKESMRYDQLRDVVARRQPGWEHLQQALISVDPVRARDDPVVVKNIPYYKAKKALEAEVMMLDPPPRPRDWGELNLPLDASSWTQEELKDPKKLHEMTTLLNAQKEIVDRILDSEWETKWRQDKLNDILQEKLQPYIQSMDNGVLPQSIFIQSQGASNNQTKRQRRWLFF